MAEAQAQDQTKQPPAGGIQNPPPAADPQKQPPAKGNADPKGGAAKGSIYEDVGLDAPETKGTATWPDSWRLDMAGGDEKLAKQLERYSSPADVGKGLLAAQQRIRSGEYKRTAAPDAADEKAMAAWREEQGIPVKAEDYAFEVEGKPLDIGTLDENAKAAVADMQKVFHGHNLNKEQAAGVSKLIVDIGMRQAEATAQADAQHYDSNEDALRADWGADFRTNVQANWNWMKGAFGEDEAAQLVEARLPNGMKLGNSPWFNKAMNAAARAVNGESLFAGTSEAKGVEARIAEIEGIMAKDMSQYTDAIAREYGDLLAKRPAKK